MDAHEHSDQEESSDGADSALSTEAGGGVGKALAVTLGVPAAIWGVERVPVVDSRWAAEPMRLGEMSLGLAPLVTAFVLVEFVALLVPAWRSLRIGGPEGRRRLTRWALWVGLVLTLMHAFSLTLFFQAERLVSGGTSFALMFGLAAWTGVIFAGSRVIDRYGLGNGFAVLLGVQMVAELGRLSLSGDPFGDAPTLETWMGAALLAAVVAVWLSSSRFVAKEGSVRLRAPLSGAVPLSIAAGLMGLAHIYTGDPGAVGEGPLVPGSTGHLIATGVVGALATVALAFVFYGPLRVARFLDGPNAEERARGAVFRALPATLVFTVGLALLYQWALVRFPLPGAVTALGAAYFGALVVDLWLEARWRSGHGEVAAVWPVHRVYAVGPVLDALAAEGIDAHARAERYRSLLQFFGPYVPIEILVPTAQQDDAVGVIERVLAGETDAEEA